MSTRNEYKGRISSVRVPSRTTLKPVCVPWAPERFDVERKFEPQETVERVQVFEVSEADIDLTPSTGPPPGRCHRGHRSFPTAFWPIRCRTVFGVANRQLYQGSPVGRKDFVTTAGFKGKRNEHL